MENRKLDIFLWITLAAVTSAAIAAPFISSNHQTAGSSLTGTRADDRKILKEARLFMIQKRYEQVESLSTSGQYQQALLKLEEITRSSPSDPHADILRGELLFKMGADAEAVKNFARGVRAEGGYVDRNTALSRRDTITSLVDSSLLKIKSDSTMQQSLADIRYLQSRLAGGCE